MSVRRLVPYAVFAALLGGAIAALLVLFSALDGSTARQLARVDASQRLLTGMLDQEAGLRAYLSTADEDLLQAYSATRSRFDTLIEAELSQTDDEELRAALLAQQTTALAWRRLAERDASTFTVDPAVYRRTLRARTAQVDRFRAQNAAYREALDDARAARDEAILLRVLAALLVLTVALGGTGLAITRRRANRRRRYAEAQAEFASAMQSAVDSSEADALLKRHLERSLAGTTVTVLRRSDADDRLEAGTPLPPDSPLAPGIVDARPRDCLAIRRGSTHVRRAGEPLVACAVCGDCRATSCRPLLVADRVIGSVLVEHDDAEVPRVRERDERVIADSLAQAAPILSGLRTLALAQSRAMTDALTGLPNRWALQDALKRMLAQTARSRSSLGLVLLDLDHFKQLNDTHGHDAGDQALAAVGHALLSELRESDLPARSGGEEFAVLLPDTPLEGALAVAEQLRRAIAAIDLPFPGVTLTASFGVAVLPLHALEADGLMRAADRALYAAKRAGRDRVEAAAAPEDGERPPRALRAAPSA
ncbi:diguanylate cyclase [Conexibacter arvalis]|uniref:Diguanylate cyclase (GGDEF)-like protein n=1 Tax=Conexibacter arvalis TaxID=912552 RepID=A0A840ICE6_9ACTN|nr:diguanylate cyclase [Conexibacter arvalis]MBB4661901.1 diguanylate cyclase (GGDEF)-like protein [Conexibacter arvalis]